MNKLQQNLSFLFCPHTGLHMEEEREGGGGCAVCSNLPIWRYFYLLCSQEGTGREEIESEADEVDHLRQLSLVVADW